MEKRNVYRKIEPVEPEAVESLLRSDDLLVKTETLISLGYYSQEPQWVIDTATPFLFDDDEWVAHGAALALLYLAMGNSEARPQVREHVTAVLGEPRRIPQRAREVLEEALTVGAAMPQRWWKRCPLFRNR